MKNLTAKEELFIGEIEKLSKGYDKNILTQFYLYWSEPDKTGKMRWELEKTWDLNRRLIRWFNNQNTWTNGNSKNPKQSPGKITSEQLHAARAKFYHDE